MLKSHVCECLNCQLVFAITFGKYKPLTCCPSCTSSNVKKQGTGAIVLDEDSFN